MPQFDLALFPAQIFWLIIFFTILMVYTVSVSVPRMKILLEERWKKTEGYRIEAGRHGIEKQALVQKVDESLATTRNKAHILITTNHGEAIRDFDKKKNSIQTSLKEKLLEVEIAIESGKLKAESEIKEHTQFITQEIVQKLLSSNGGDKNTTTMKN